MNSTLDSIDLLVGTRAPTKSAVAARLTGGTSSADGSSGWYMERLSEAELWCFEMLVRKASVPLEDSTNPDADLDVIREVIVAYQEGNLPREGKAFYDLSDEELARLQNGEKIYQDDNPFPYGRPIRLVEDADIVED